MKTVSYFILLLVSIAGVTACARHNPNPGLAQSASAPKSIGSDQTAAAVPVDYQSLYKYLDGKLDNFSAQLSALPKKGAPELTFAAELLVANGNRGEELLQPQTFQAAKIYLDRLQTLGVHGVKVAIKYPLLTSDFPRSNEYIAFYKKISQELKQRNMKMLAGTGVAFTQPEFSSVKVNYRGMTIEKLKSSMRQHIETIAREIQPDYLTVANEPGTETELTGIKFSVADYADYVNSMLEGLDRRGILVGAGTGNWDDPAFIQALATSTSVDYIDIHFYPLNHEFTARAIQQANIARGAGKRLIIGENWLYKAGENEIGGASAVEIIARDAFSFWQPLDAKFLTLMSQFARAEGVEFMSPFWSKYFFAYADYSSVQRGATNGEIMRAADADIANNVMRGTFTGTGLAYQHLAEGK